MCIHVPINTNPFYDKGPVLIFDVVKHIRLWNSSPAIFTTNAEGTCILLSSTSKFIGIHLFQVLIKLQMVMPLAEPVGDLFVQIKFSPF